MVFLKTKPQQGVDALDNAGAGVEGPAGVADLEVAWLAEAFQIGLVSWFKVSASEG